MTSYDKRLDELQAVLFKRLPNDWYYHIDTQGVPQASIHKDAVESIMDIISDWHNKQVEAVLDKFEQDCKLNYTTWGNSERMLQVSGILKRIEAERNKLKEANQ